MSMFKFGDAMDLTKQRQMNRILGKIDLMVQQVVDFPQLLARVHKSLAILVGFQTVCKGNVQWHTQGSPCPNSRCHSYSHRCFH